MIQNKAMIFFLIGGLILFSASCKKSNPDGREDVRGKISLNGKPIATGGISFEPIDGQPGDGSTGQVMDGTYFVTGANGVKPGKYKVKITSIATFDKKTNDYATDTTRDADEYAVKLIPDDFNLKSKIEFEVIKGKNNVFNYDVQTDFKPERIDKGKREIPQ